MSILRVSLFGKFHVHLGEQVLAGLNARKVQELFCYLLLYRDRPHPREILASLLWGDSFTTQSRRYLRKALWQLKVTLDCQTGPSNNRILLVEPDWVQINSDANLWLDVAVFEHAFTLVQGVPGRELDFQCVETVRNAVDLYQGDLLRGWYQDWCLYERERLQHWHLAMLDKLMDYCEMHHEYETGLAYGARILRYDRARECTHRRLMRLQYLAGNRTAALRQYERCLTALDEELGVRPAKRTVALYEQIRADQLHGPTPAPVEASITPRVLTPPLPEVLSRLQRLEVILADVQRQVQQDIQVAERALNDQPYTDHRLPK